MLNSPGAGKCILIGALSLVTFVPLASAKKLTPEQVLYKFCSLANCSDGAQPYSGLIMDGSSNLYGTTTRGGGTPNCPSNKPGIGCGTVFKLAPDGTETVLYTFCSQTNCSDGAVPTASLVMDGAGNLYGTTEGFVDCAKEAETCGSVFKIAPDGTETTLYSFCSQANCADGTNPYAGLIMDSSGNLYGTTQGGIPNSSCYLSGFQGCGTVFKITANGTEKVLYSFCSQADCTDGDSPSSGLYMDGSGNLWGTTTFGGAHNYGEVYELSSGGVERVLYSFQGGSDGGESYSGLIADASGNLYGTTSSGGGTGCGIGCGTVFKLSPGGTETILHSFAGGSDGDTPYAGLIADSAGNLYGTTYDGGSTGCKKNGCGIVFKLAPSGSETVLYAFKSYKYGQRPLSNLIADNQGNLYGTTTVGGESNESPTGVVYKINISATADAKH